jgi:hypothetical protein
MMIVLKRVKKHRKLRLIVDNRNTGEQNKQLALTNSAAIHYNKTVMITIIKLSIP